MFISHNGKRTSRKEGDRKSAEAVASTIRAKLQLGEFGFEEKKAKSIPSFKLYAESFIDTYSAMNHKKSEVDQLDSKTAPTCTPLHPVMIIQLKKG